MTETIFIGVAWPYASGPRHLGHVAGFGIPSDIFARYHRLKGNRVLMVSGTDEHGTPIMVAADKEGVSPAELSERYSRVIAQDLLNLGLSYDIFTRTTTTNHYSVVQNVFKTLYNKGYIIPKTVLGAFSDSGKTLPDRYIEGTCPHCGYGEARGDQCDNCGNQLDPVDLIDPRSTIDGTPPVFRETEHLFLDLPAFASRLSEWVGGQTEWRQNVKKFSLNLIEDLKPRPITRDLDWGVPIPVEGYEDKRIYVWFDAVIGYLSASIEWAAASEDPEGWKSWWQDPDSSHYYFMGKDNIVFHTVIWPSMLMGFDESLQLPHNLVASEFLTMEGRQFSASRGVAIYINDFLERYDPDPLRYYLTAAGPESQDTDFTWAEFIRRNNDELVASWGNLVNRVLVTAHRSYGKIPAPGELLEEDRDLIREIEAGFGQVGLLIEAAEFKKAIGEAMALVQRANQYYSQQAPWKTAESDPTRTQTVVHTGLSCIANLSVMLAPFLPFSSGAIHKQLGLPGDLSPMPVLGGPQSAPGPLLWGEYSEGAAVWGPQKLEEERSLDRPTAPFKKLDPKTAEDELARMQA